jgi:Tol biopolymer transport system component
LDWTNNDRILFTGAKDQSWVIFSANPDGSNLKQLTSTGFVDVSVSATLDGHFIFQSNRGGSTEIWRANADGSDLQQLTTGGGNSFPHVTPNGEWVVYGSVRQNKSGVWRIALAGGEPARLIENESGHPRVSPDGKLIACTYQAGDDSHRQIALVPVAGGAPVKLFDLPRSATFLDGLRWTPDGKAVSYLNRGGGIWKQDIGGGEPQLQNLPQPRIRAYGWTRDGKHFVFSSGEGVRDAVLIRNRN